MRGARDMPDILANVDSGVISGVTIPFEFLMNSMDVESQKIVDGCAVASAEGA